MILSEACMTRWIFKYVCSNRLTAGRLGNIATAFCLSSVNVKWVKNRQFCVHFCKKSIRNKQDSFPALAWNFPRYVTSCLTSRSHVFCNVISSAIGFPSVVTHQILISSQQKGTFSTMSCLSKRNIVIVMVGKQTKLTS